MSLYEIRTDKETVLRFINEITKDWRQFPNPICASGNVRMYRKSEIESWMETQAEQHEIVNSQ